MSRADLPAPSTVPPPPPPQLVLRPAPDDPITALLVSTNQHNRESLLQSLSLPSPSSGRSHNISPTIRIYHPHYAAGDDLLLSLPAPDHSDGGLQYHFVFAACTIIVGNRTDGWLSRTRDGGDGGDGGRLGQEYQVQDILPSGNYFFYLPDSSCDTPYAIVPTFRDWTFPHQNLPAPWDRLSVERGPVLPPRSFSSSNLTSSLASRDVTCRMSGYAEGTHAAHLCPASEEIWFNRNSMSTYAANFMLSPPINDTANAILLRSDLHAHLDSHKLTFVPKGTVDKVQLVSHVLVPSQELLLLYHNVPLLDIAGASVECFFARFALAVFQFVGSFLSCGVPRHLIGRSISVNDQPVKMTGAQCRSLVASSRSRSQSPKKRAREPGTEQVDVAEDVAENQQGSEHPSSRRMRFFKRRRVSSRLGQDECPSPSQMGVAECMRQSSDGSTVALGSYKPGSAPRPPSSSSSAMQEDCPSRNISLPTPKEHEGTGTCPSTPAIAAAMEQASTPRMEDNLDNPDNLYNVRRQWLHAERLRSDPEASWQREVEWADQIRKEGRCMDVDNVKRLWAVYGYEINEVDDNDE